MIELRTYAGLRAQGKCDTFLGFLDHLGRTEGFLPRSEQIPGEQHQVDGAAAGRLGGVPVN